METHKIDSLVKNALSGSENFYDSEAIIAKERIWNHIHPQKQPTPLFLRLLAAASILLLMGLSAVAFFNMRYKSTINTLVESNTHLENELLINKQNSLANKQALASFEKQIPDTIYMEKKVIEYKPLVTTTHITDTVYVEQIVYVEKEPDANLLTVNENVSSSDSPAKLSENYYQSDIIISSSETIKKEKRKKMQIRFGGNKAQIRNGTLAVSTKL